MTGNKLKLTKRSVEMLIEQHLPGRAQRVWDTEIAPFYLNLTPNGVASYRLRFTKANGVKSDFTIGRANVIGPDQARDVARAKMADLVANNIDPVIARTTSKIHARGAKSRTFKAVAQGYIAERYEQQVTKKPLMDEYILDRYVLDQIGHLDVTEITTKTVKNLIKKIPATVEQRQSARMPHWTGEPLANSVHHAVRRVLGKSVTDEHLSANPAAFARIFDRAPAARREVRLTEDRFRLLWAELEKTVRANRQVSARAIQLYMLSLQRPGEIARAQKAQINLDSMVWELPTSGNTHKKTNSIPISEAAEPFIRRAIRESHGVHLFSFGLSPARSHLSPSAMRTKFKSAIETLKEAGVWPDGPEVNLYDCRRFGQSQLIHNLEFDPAVVERVLNHSLGRAMMDLSKAQDYSSAVREAHNAWGNEVIRMIAS